jgi:predicted nucleic acid-binding Zn ribbon protein
VAGEQGPPGAGDDGTSDPTHHQGAEADADDVDRGDAAQLALSRARDAARERGQVPGRAGTRPRRRGPAGHAPDVVPGAGRDPQPVGDAMDRLSAQLGWGRSLQIGGVVGRWREVVGDRIADHCVPETFTEGALVVRADSTAWATQIRLLLPQLERRLAEEVGEGAVTSIQVLGPGGPTWRKGPRSVQGGRGPRDTYG